MQLTRAASNTKLYKDCLILNTFRLINYVPIKMTLQRFV